MAAHHSAPQIAASLSTLVGGMHAAEEAAGAVAQQLGEPADLVFVFASASFAAEMEGIAAIVRRQTGAKTLLGCTGESIVGNDREIEQAPALAVWGARLPGAVLHPLRLEFERTPEGGSIVGWPGDLPESWPAGAAAVMLGEPFSFPADLLLERLNEDQPGTPVIGGMASGGWGPGQNRIVLNDAVYTDGAVGVLIHGKVRVRSLVSQGCRPIGRHFVVTKAQQNIIVELSGKPAMQQLQEVYAELTPQEQALVRNGLHVGRVTNEYQGEFRRGDFLVRNVVGADPESGVIAIGDFVRPGQTVQFHLRDAASADEDLQELLATHAVDAGSPPAGGLLFTCNGRGTRLFDAEHHDAATVGGVWPGLPLAGFFAQGEMGPVGGKNFVHGFTASLALFEAADE